uniref:Tetraspanin 8 n=1 Tax=Apteryx owenii TaxID=8824 RepID=A0A8B9S3R1_APTOW
MAGVSRCMKYSMFIFNFLFWFQIDSSTFAGVDLLIAVGSIIMVLGFLGCCGAIKESRCMLLLFFIGLLLILILQVTAGILGAVYRSQIETTLNSTLAASIKTLQSSTEESKVFQEKFQTYEREVIKMYQRARVVFIHPVSSICPCFILRIIIPCGELIINYLKDHMIIIMGIAFGLAVIEILGLGFSMSLYCQIQRK